MGLIANLRDDIVCALGALRALRATLPIARNPTRVFPQVMIELAQTHGDAPALLSDREQFTYRELAARANRYAHWAHAQGIAKGDTVCLLMPNRPEYMAVWLGITQAGGVAALLNTNLTGPSLAHCINVVTPKHIIVAADLYEMFAQAQGLLAGAAQRWLHGESAAAADLPRIDTALASLPDTPLPPDKRPALTTEDRALYIYTSGTTGLPKAANINHYRLMLASYGFSGIMNTRASDRMYDCLPMYHTVGGVCATGALLVNGGSVVIRERFSAHEFWSDVARWDCTLFQYIGELCRYLVNQPPQPDETKHRLRLCCGNGLRPDVWGEFKRRFRIPSIVEFYAATEGNVTMFNFEGKEGAIGRIPWFLEHRFPTKLVKFDLDREQPVRGPDGLCVECGPGEIGEAIGKILRDLDKPSSRFEGYATEQENERKILRNVFGQGDAWFRTGDLMRRDARGYFYFVDRIGDTFRWKGENVSTGEVQEAITGFPGIVEANVYGVHIPGRDGRAGMAALAVDGRFDLNRFSAFLAERLPEYAQPLFVRLRGEIETTATFKQKKVDLVKQGFDPSGIADDLYFHDSRARTFVRLDPALYRRINDGEVRL